MANRHQRRKKAELRKALLTISEAQRDFGRNTAAIVKRNLATPKGERVIMYDRFGIPHERRGLKHSFAQSSVTKVVEGSQRTAKNAALRVSPLFDKRTKDAARFEGDFGPVHNPKAKK